MAGTPDSASDSEDSSSETSFIAQDARETNIQDERPQKRRRLSDSSEDSPIASTAPFPVQTLSRIKKKDAKSEKPEETASQADPVTANDAFEMGLQSADSSFASLGLAPWLVNSLKAMEIKRPTAIQKSCIPEIIKGRDCIGGSRTGSGKTVAFAAPILHKWSADPFGIYAVILTPTRYGNLQENEK